MPPYSHKETSDWSKKEPMGQERFVKKWSHGGPHGHDRILTMCVLCKLSGVMTVHPFLQSTLSPDEDLSLEDSETYKDTPSVERSGI
jgi:hypothetical protein